MLKLSLVVLAGVVLWWILIIGALRLFGRRRKDIPE